MTFVQSAESNFKKLLGRYHKQSFLPSPSFCGLTLLFVGTLNSHSRQEKHLRFFTLKPTVVYLIPLEATSHAMRCTRGNCKKKNNNKQTQIINHNSSIPVSLQLQKSQTDCTRTLNNNLSVITAVSLYFAVIVPLNDPDRHI